MLGQEFLPSPEWVATSRYYAIGVGLFGAVCLSWWVRKILQGPPSNKRYQIVDALLSSTNILSSKATRRKISIVLVPVAGFAAGFGLLSTLLPWASAVAAGEETEYRYTVERTANRSKCRSAVYLRDMPTGADRICNLPEWVRISINPGDVLVVSGRGTSLGIFVERIRLIRQEGAAESELGE